MKENNVTFVFLMGFPGLHDFRILVFLVLLIMYCLIILGNLLIIVLVFRSKILHSPMYFFISQVSVFDILLTADVVPNMFPIILRQGSTISLQNCIAQFFFFTCTEGAECFLLAVMSYDRYLAISNPLRYSQIVNPMFCLRSMIFVSVLSVSLTLMDAIPMKDVNFCGPNIIDHFFCDLVPLLELSCSDISMIQSQTIFICFSVLICPLIIIVMSYVHVVLTILAIPTINGRKKAFSTCSSHLTAVCLFYGSLISTYMTPHTEHLVILNKMISLFYTVITPLLNPIIYSLRNKDFKEAFQKIKNAFFHHYK